MFVQDGLFELSAVGGWSKAFGELHRRIGHRFARRPASGSSAISLVC